MDVRELDPIKAAALNVLLMVHELHKLGYQRLRIVPGMSPSQAYWRVTILPRSRILRSHGAMSHDWAWGGPEPFFTSGQEGRYFGWEDAQDDTPSDLAAKFIARFPGIAEAARGSDWPYAGWYLEMLSKARLGEFPVAYAEWYEEPNPQWLPTTGGVESGLAMPPPGDDDGGMDAHPV
jgi:hypothetical protein